MTKSSNAGYVDTPIEGVTSLNFPRTPLNFKKDFRVKSSNDGKEVILTNITTPIDRPERIRLGFNEVSNVYAGTGIDPSVLAPTKKGVNLLAQITEVISVTDDKDADYRVDLPISCHLVIKVPASEHIDAWRVQTVLSRLMSTLFDSGSESRDRLEAMLRGSLIPQDM